MPLNAEELKLLLKFAKVTQPVEISCDACATDLAAFVERELAGAPAAQERPLVALHLAMCGHCLEEHRALVEALRT